MLRLRLLLVALGIHCLFHIYGALGGPGLENAGFAGDVFQFYGRFSGCTTEFGFFAPRPGSPLRVAIQAHAGDQIVRDEIFKVRTAEGQHRLEALIGQLRNERTPEQTQILAMSLSAAVFDRDPSVTSVVISIQAKSIPQFTEGLRGESARWIEIASVTVNRDLSTIHHAQESK